MQEGRILTLPMLLHSHSPNLDRLPLFLVRLATEVNIENTHMHDTSDVYMYTCIPACYWLLYNNIIAFVHSHSGGVGDGERVFPDICSRVW